MQFPNVPVKAVLAAVVVLGLAGGAWLALSGPSEKAGARGPGARGQGSVRTVLAERVQTVTFGDRVEAIGTVVANESVTVTAKTQGIMRRINFDDGQTVKAGEEIAAIDSGAEDSALNVELANVEQQRKELDRIRELAKTNFVSQARLDEQIAAVKKAEANVVSARVRSTDRRIVAPFSGIVGTRRISLGALVSPGTAVVTLDDISVVKLDFAIPETFMASLRPGLSIEASSSAYRGEAFKGEVQTVDARVDPATRSVNIRALVPNPDLRLRPGMLMVVDLTKDERAALMVPEAALVPENGAQYVYVVGGDNVANRVPVIIGTRRMGSVEIVKGVKEGDLVIKEGMQDMRSGTPVSILNGAELGLRLDQGSEAARITSPRRKAS